MPDSLYDRDVLVWCDQQAEQLRRLAAGERPNAPIDWENVVEELESVGRSELRACSSLLQQAMLHVMKLTLAPDSVLAGHWRSEVVAFLVDARQGFTPSMRQRIDLGKAYDAAWTKLEAAEGFGVTVERLPSPCPFQLDDLLARKPDVSALAAQLSQAAS